MTNWGHQQLINPPLLFLVRQTIKPMYTLFHIQNTGHEGQLKKITYFSNNFILSLFKQIIYPNPLKPFSL